MAEQEKIPYEYILQVLGAQALELSWLRGKVVAQAVPAQVPQLEKPHAAQPDS